MRCERITSLYGDEEESLDEEEMPDDDEDGEEEGDEEDEGDEGSLDFSFSHFATAPENPALKKLGNTQETAIALDDSDDEAGVETTSMNERNFVAVNEDK